MNKKSVYCLIKQNLCFGFYPIKTRLFFELSSFKQAKKKDLIVKGCKSNQLIFQGETNEL